jgi:hypothetical protein
MFISTDVFAPSLNKYWFDSFKLTHDIEKTLPKLVPIISLSSSLSFIIAAANYFYFYFVDKEKS